MSDSFPTELVSLPTSNFQDFFACSICNLIPDPKNYLFCEDEGHLVCRPCAIAMFEEAEEGGGKDKGYGVPCCSPDKLVRGPRAILETILDNCTWKCRNSDKGCPALFSGKEWYNHIRCCTFTGSVWPCYYLDCVSVCTSIQELLSHYKRMHDASIIQEDKLVDDRHIFHLPFNLAKKDKNSDQYRDPQRLLAILKVEQCHFMLSVELRDSLVHIWVWSIDNEFLGHLTGLKYCVKLIPAQREQERDASLKYDEGVPHRYSAYPPEAFTRKTRVQFKDVERGESLEHLVVGREKLEERCLDAEGVANLYVSIRKGKMENLGKAPVRFRARTPPNEH